MIRIVVADDHEVIRRGVCRLIGEHQGWQVCGEADNGIDAVRITRQVEPDIAVLDVGMPGMNGFEATEQIKGVCPQVEVLIYSVQESEQLIRRCVEAGARGYALKADLGGCLFEALDAISRHKSYFPTKGQGNGLKPFSGSTPLLPFASLTARECEIIQKLAEGHSNKEIARILFISVKTVETHRSIIKRKLGISSIVDLVHFAVRNNLIRS